MAGELAFTLVQLLATIVGVAVFTHAQIEFGPQHWVMVARDAGMVERAALAARIAVFTHAQIEFGPGTPEEQYQIHPLDMKIFLSLCLFVALLGLACSARLRREEKKKFTTQYDNVDLDVILKNPRLLNGYLDCLVRDGNCTPDGKELKENGNPICKHHSKYTRPRFEPRSSVRGSLVYCESSAIDHVATKTCPVISAIYGFRDPSVLVGTEGYFESLADALANDCDKCSEKQKAGSDKVIKHLIAHQPEDWKDVEKKYDSEGAYRKRHNL
uniref:(California timema) hypothetical protein n=1 Tax=Timema californicum TaxID=61474 RepID=A0A7R9PBJ2_TIMCA|nr:unnamed protein product [Timema californicum]